MRDRFRFDRFEAEQKDALLNALEPAREKPGPSDYDLAAKDDAGRVIKDVDADGNVIYPTQAAPTGRSGLEGGLSGMGAPPPMPNADNLASDAVDFTTNLAYDKFEPHRQRMLDSATATGQANVGFAQDLANYARGTEGWKGMQVAGDEWKNIVDSDGFTDQFKATTALNRAEADSWAQGQREAILTDLAERGQLGSGSELSSLMNANQAAAQRNYLGDLGASAQAEQFRTDALGNYQDNRATLAKWDTELASHVADAKTDAQNSLQAVENLVNGRVFQLTGDTINAFTNPNVAGADPSRADTAHRVVGDTSNAVTEGFGGASSNPTPTTGENAPDFVPGTDSAGGGGLDVDGLARAGATIYNESKGWGNDGGGNDGGGNNAPPEDNIVDPWGEGSNEGPVGLGPGLYRDEDEIFG